MKKIAGLRFSTLPEVILLSSDGKFTVSLLQENHDHGQTSSSNRIILDGDDVDTSTTTLSSNPVSGNFSDISPPVCNPTPLRWYRPPEEGVDSPTDHHHDVETPSNPTVLNDRDGANAVEVDTTLRLSNYVAGNPNIPPAKINPTPPLGWFLPDFFDGVEDDVVDTTLSLSPPCSTDLNKLRKLLQAKKGKRKAEADADVGEDRPKKIRSRRSNNGDDEDQRPLIPIELIPGLQNIVSGNGTRPTFLYRKKLAKSDVKRYQNRLFVTRIERMMEFLRGEEAAVVDGGEKGLKIVGVDGEGKVYENLGLRKWASLKMTVINSDWWRLVAANNAIKGDVVEIWGYRENEKPFFAFNFRRENGGDHNDAGTSGTHDSKENGGDHNAAGTSSTHDSRENGEDHNDAGTSGTHDSSG